MKIKSKQSSLSSLSSFSVSILSLLVVGILIISSNQAFADTNVGAIIQQADKEIVSIPALASDIAFVIASILTVVGILRVKQHIENANQVPLSRAIFMLAAAGILFSLPFFVSMLTTSLSVPIGDGTPTGDMATGIGTSGAGAVAVSGASLDKMLTSFVTNIRGPLLALANVLAFALGLILIIQGILSLTHYGTDPRSHSAKNIAAKMAVGAVLMVIPQVVDATSMSLFGQTTQLGTTVALAYDPSAAGTPQGGTSPAAASIEAVLQFVQIIGFIGFVRGWLMLRAAVEGAGQVSQGAAFTHILGGALAINIVPTVKAIQATLGISVIS